MKTNNGMSPSQLEELRQKAHNLRLSAAKAYGGPGNKDVQTPLEALYAATAIECILREHNLKPIAYPLRPIVWPEGRYAWTLDIRRPPLTNAETVDKRDAGPPEKEEYPPAQLFLF